LPPYLTCTTQPNIAAHTAQPNNDAHFAQPNIAETQQTFLNKIGRKPWQGLEKL
jgi:hypothetical protein